MIYLKLFLSFLEIGAVSFGGGYGMISLIREKVLINNWMTEDEFLNIIAVSESTPGPIAVNMATFVGSAQGGLFGSFVATLGVVLPSFIIILVIAAFICNLLKYKGVNAFLGGIRPCIVGLILATALTMFLGNLAGIKTYNNSVDLNLPGLIIFAILIVFSLIWKKWRHKAPSPIIMICISAGLGLILYPIL